MKIQKGFTFDDWKNGKIPYDSFDYFPNEGAFALLKFEKEDLSTLWKFAEIISKETEQKIKKEKKRAFVIGTKNSAESKYRNLRSYLENVPAGQHQNFIKLEIDKINNWFKGGELVRQRVMAGEVNINLITPELYKRFLNDKQRLEKDPEYIAEVTPSIKKETENGAEFVPIDNKLFFAHANYRYLQMIQRDKYQKSTANILSKECLDKIREITDKHPVWGTNPTFEKAYECEDCKYELVNRERKEIGSWRTLFRRVKKHYPDLYEKTKAQK